MPRRGAARRTAASTAVAWGSSLAGAPRVAPRSRPRSARGRGTRRRIDAPAGREAGKEGWTFWHDEGAILRQICGLLLWDQIMASGGVRALGDRGGADLRLTSVKGNIGHANCAAGLTGLLKAALALAHVCEADPALASLAERHRHVGLVRRRRRAAPPDA